MLIHPTHRKYIRLLRDRANCGYPIIITKKDREDFLKLVKSTNERYKRHQGIYRITLRAMNRSQEDIALDDIHAILDKAQIDIIERTFSRLERKQLCATLQGTYLRPIVLALLKRLKQKTKT